MYGIYVLIKEVVDNSVDEFIMGAGHRVEITVEQNEISVPFFSATPDSQRSLCSSPLAKVTVRASPSRTERAVNSLESILTALTPTPFRLSQRA